MSWLASLFGFGTDPAMDAALELEKQYKAMGDGLRRCAMGLEKGMKHEQTKERYCDRAYLRNEGRKARTNHYRASNYSPTGD